MEVLACPRMRAYHLDVAWKMKRSELDILMGGKADDKMFEAWREAGIKPDRRHENENDRFKK